MFRLIAILGLASALAGCVAEAPGYPDYGYYPDGYYGYGPDYEPGFAYGAVGIGGGSCCFFDHHDHDHDHDHDGGHGHGWGGGWGHGGGHGGVWTSGGGWGGHGGGHGGGGSGGGGGGSSR
ncbi:hypothetical protein AAHK20_12710 [Trinickia sp. YCB016]